jgi:hypothetical protein
MGCCTFPIGQVRQHRNRSDKTPAKHLLRLCLENEVFGMATQVEFLGGAEGSDWDTDLASVVDALTSFSCASGSACRFFHRDSADGDVVTGER